MGKTTRKSKATTTTRSTARRPVVRAPEAARPTYTALPGREALTDAGLQRMLRRLKGPRP